MTTWIIEPSVQVALIGFAGVVVTSVIGALIAFLTSRKEKTMVAETTLEKAYEQRLLLRDEQLADSRKDVQDLLTQRSELVSKLTLTYEENALLKARLDKYEHGYDPSLKE